MRAVKRTSPAILVLIYGTWPGAKGHWLERRNRDTDCRPGHVLLWNVVIRLNSAAAQHRRPEGFMSQRIDLCSTGDVTPGNVIKVETGDLTLAVYNLDGEFYVTDDL